MKNKFLIRKNILDADLQKYLQIASISIILGFTYLIGVVIAFLTHQINLESFIDIVVLSILSILILVPVVFFFINSITKIKRITKAIRALEKVGVSNFPTQ